MEGEFIVCSSHIDRLDYYRGMIRIESLNATPKVEYSMQGVEYRMQITKKALAESLKKQMQTIPLAKITVNDIVKECGLNRRTLYYYFNDIYDLLEWIYKTELKEVLGENRTYTSWQKGLLEIFEYLYQK